ncbi:MAG: class I SAM-dependent rRNA methyltransferase [Nitrospinales bacterium]
MTGASQTAKPGTFRIKISKTSQRKIRRGYPWIFRHQVHDDAISGAPGDLGVVYDADNRFLAIGIYDPFSEISLRILQTGAPAVIDAAFFRKRFAGALALRKSLADEHTTGYRALNGESDGFPGLILDRYADTAVIKIYSCAWAPYLETIRLLAHELLPVKRCVLRLSRKVEASRFPGDGEILSGPPLQSAVRFQESGLWFEADVVRGQKTGFYFDQRENRRHVRELAQGKSVLNVFSYTGGFSVYAFAGGCRSVLEIELNRHALQAARNNWALNFPETAGGKKSFRQIQGDVFRELDRLNREGQRFDLVILDPPAFARGKKQVPDALTAYTRLAEAGARRTAPGGILFTASCSAPVEAREFFLAVDRGIEAAGRLREEMMRTRHAVDHPAVFKEANYLKGVFHRILQ